MSISILGNQFASANPLNGKNHSEIDIKVDIVSTTCSLALGILAALGAFFLMVLVLNPMLAPAWIGVSCIIGVGSAVGIFFACNNIFKTIFSFSTTKPDQSRNIKRLKERHIDRMFEELEEFVNFIENSHTHVIEKATTLYQKIQMDIDEAEVIHQANLSQIQYLTHKVQSSRKGIVLVAEKMKESFLKKSDSVLDEIAQFKGSNKSIKGFKEYLSQLSMLYDQEMVKQEKNFARILKSFKLEQSQETEMSEMLTSSIKEKIVEAFVTSLESILNTWKSYNSQLTKIMNMQ